MQVVSAKTVMGMRGEAKGQPQKRPHRRFLQFLRRLSARVVEFGTVTFFPRDLDEASPALIPFPGFSIRLASESDVDQIVAGYDHAKSVTLMRERFRSGHLCVVALDDAGGVVHCRWISTGTGHIPELSLDIRLGSGEAYFYDGYTRRDSRGKGIDPAVRGWIFKYLHDAGFRRVYSYVRSDNPIGLKAARRLQRSAQGLRYVRLLGLRPLVFGSRDLGGSVLVRSSVPPQVETERSHRIRVWREWFESWRSEPLAKRSMGFHALPDASFIATADYLSGVLRLNPETDVVLDVGCDSAMISRFVASRCRRLIGVDFIPGLLPTLPDGPQSATHRRADYLAADGRCLPFLSQKFTKSYCSAVLHTLPSREDGLAMIRELVRVTRPGGMILLAAVPDRAKRYRRYWEAWRGADIGGKLRVVAAIVLPPRIRPSLRRLLRQPTRHQLAFLEFDFRRLKDLLEAEGLMCDILHFPRDYWSRDFRTTRTNLLIRIPRAAQHTAVV